VIEKVDIDIVGDSIAAAIPDPLDLAEAMERRLRVERAVSQLPNPCRLVVTLRYGLDGPSFALREIGWLLRRSSERVRQIEARALRRLRQEARQSGIHDYDANAREV
jgi:RNA polymerase primary sigma factor